MSDLLQYRIVYRRPASIFDLDHERARGYVEDVTAACTSPDAARRSEWALRRQEESLASIVRVERRVIHAEPWEPVDG